MTRMAMYGPIHDMSGSCEQEIDRRPRIAIVTFVKQSDHHRYSWETLAVEDVLSEAFAPPTALKGVFKVSCTGSCPEWSILFVRIRGS